MNLLGIVFLIAAVNQSAMTAAKIVFIKTRKFKIIAIVVVLLIVLRLILPFIVLHFANQSLANMRGYYGHINDIDLALIKGSYTVDSIYLNKVDTITKKQTPFFSALHVELAVEWRALLHRSLAGEVIMKHPVLLFTKDKVEPGQLIRDSSYLKMMLDKSMPLEINRFEVIDGIIRYKDEGSTPPVDIEINNAHMLAENLRNSYDSSSLLPAKIKAIASVYEGTLDFTMKLDPMSVKTNFDMNSELKNTNLVKLNDFFQAYAKVDVNKGVFGMYVEAAALDGKLTGYIKPVITDLDVLGKEDRNDNVFRLIWEGAVGSAGQVLKNQSKDQIATKIPFEGKLNDPNANSWYAIMNILKNGFIKAIVPVIDNEINIESVDNPKEVKKTFLQKVFGKRNRKPK